MHQRRLIADTAFEDNWPTSTKTAVTPAAVADDPQRTLVALINGWRVVKSFRYLLTDPCELNILQRRPGWREIGCSSIDNAVLDPGGT
jgi:hypothetical protein